MTYEELKQIISKEEPYYSKFPGCDNAYRDGYLTEPPRKPRPSYLFFQSLYRTYFQKMYPNASHSKIMSLLGEAWNALTEEQQLPFIMLGNDEAAQFEKEKVLLEKAQKPTEVWQPIRRCYAVLDRLCKDEMADIFLEPVDTDEFDDYLDVVDFPMDLGTVRERLASVKNWQGPEVFARDVRKVRPTLTTFPSSILSYSFLIVFLSLLLRRSGITVRFTMPTEPLFGTLLTICQSYLKEYTMHGSLTSATVIYVGLIQLQDHGKRVAVDVTVNAKEMRPAKYSVITVMQTTTSNASNPN